MTMKYEVIMLMVKKGNSGLKDAVQTRPIGNCQLENTKSLSLAAFDTGNE